MRTEIKQNCGSFLCWHTQNLQADISMELWMCLYKLVHLNQTLMGQFARTQQTL
jgi:hypothetical protein